MCDIAPGTVIQGYEFLEKIDGKGFMTVYRGRSIRDQTPCCIKVANVREDRLQGAWFRFYGAMQRLRALEDPNIVKLYDGFQRGHQFFAVMEYCSNGSLQRYIEKNAPLVGMALLQAVKGLCSALESTWNRGMSHRDVRPGSVLLDEKFRVKLTNFDLGVAESDCDDREISLTACLESLSFRSPEVIRGLAHNPIKSDIWALGVTILTIATGSVPWGQIEEKAMTKKIVNNDWTFPDDMNKGMKKLIWDMMQPQPEVRAVVADRVMDQMLLEESKVTFGEFPLVRERATSLRPKIVAFSRPGPEMIRRGTLSIKKTRRGTPQVLSPLLFGRISGATPNLGLH